MSSKPERKLIEKKQLNESLRQLILEMSNLTAQMQEFQRIAEEAATHMLASKNNPQVQQEISARLNQVLGSVKMHVLAQLISEKCLSLFSAGACTKNQYQLVRQLMESLGPTRFVQKVLLSECAEDIGLAISLQEIVPVLESFVDTYPALFLDQANEILAGVRYRPEQ